MNLKLFKVTFTNGKINEPEAVHRLQFCTDRQYSRLGELEWLIVASQTKDEALKEAKKELWRYYSLLE